MCPTHGGSAPQVQFKAAINVELERQRFITDLPDANAVMHDLLTDEDASVRLRAAQIYQDRAWGRALEKHKISGDANDPLEIVISRPEPTLPAP